MVVGERIVEVVVDCETVEVVVEGQGPSVVEVLEVVGPVIVVGGVVNDVVVLPESSVGSLRE